MSVFLITAIDSVSVCTNFNNLCLAQNWCITSISQIEVGVYRVLNREGNDIELDLDNNLLDS